METIFNHNPTPKELNDIRFDSLSLCLKFGIDIKEELTPAIYTKLISQENAYYDLACLFEFRVNKNKANQYWSKLPETHRIKGLGCDNLEITA
ncbi:hypothetical protein ACNQF7_03835 [Flavobacterium sp. RSP29]|uniref:hypothetical protein n=1 Tax=Flavobacterium sp. RSP29 TaxID=3401731 RepID=UPI003AADB553